MRCDGDSRSADSEFFNAPNSLILLILRRFLAARIHVAWRFDVHILYG